MAQNTRKLVGVILMLAMLVAAIAALTVTAAAADTTVSISVFGSNGSLASDSSSISWTSDGVTVVNEKASSSTAIRTSDTNHYRAYTGSAMTFSIAEGNITKIVITCTSSSYATVMKNSAGAEATVSGSVVTIVPTAQASVYNIAKITAQTRFSKVDVTYSVGGCTHTGGTATCKDQAICEICEQPYGALGDHTGGTATCVDQAICEICEQPYGDPLGHNFVDGACSACGEEEPNEVVFEFGANGSATHTDGTEKATYTETVGEYTLNITSGTKMYTGARDAQGNSCIKLGTSSAAAKLTFAVGADVKYVIINVAGYKTNNANLKINGTAYTVSTASDNGKYTAIEIDTTTIKTISLETTSGGYRAMINSIVFGIEVSECGHENTTTTTVDAKCNEAGSEVVKCDDCNTIISEKELPATGIHNYVDGVCSVCEAIEPANLAGRYYIATIRTEGNYFYMTSDLGTASTKRYTAVDSGLTVLPASINVPQNGYVFVLVRNADYTYCIYAEGVEGNSYLGWSSGNSGILVDEENAIKFDVDFNEDGTYSFHFAASDGERYLSLNGAADSDYYAMYKGTQKQNLSLVSVVGTACEHEYEYDCSTKCSICGEGEREASHSYFYPCDPVCQICYEITNPDAAHTIVAVEAKAATCTENGNIAYWYCSDCGSAWADEALTQITNMMSVKTPATGHSYTEFDKVALEGVNSIPVAVYKCANCEATDNRSIVTFIGGSIRYADVNGVECGTDKIALRFGYQIDVNVINYFGGLEAFKAIADWSWTYSAVVGDDTKSASVAGYYITEDGVTNLVLTNIPLEYITTEFTVDFTLTLNGENIQGKFEKQDSRTSMFVLEETYKNENDEGAIAYAKKVLEAYKTNCDETYVLPTKEEENA